MVVRMARGRRSVCIEELLSNILFRAEWSGVFG